MTNPLVKMREMQTAMRELEAAMQALQSDPSLRVELEFESDLQALLAKYDKTIHDAAKVVDPTFEVVVRKAGRAYGPRPRDEHGNILPPKKRKKHPDSNSVFFLFANPHTGEVVRAGNILNKVVKVWVEKYGKDEVLKWRSDEPRA